VLERCGKLAGFLEGTFGRQEGMDLSGVFTVVLFP
jgi:hypothetical protein